MTFTYYIKLFQASILLFFQEFVLRLCAVLDEVPLLQEDTHKAAKVPLVPPHNNTQEFDLVLENGKASSAGLLYIWVLVGVSALAISILKKGSGVVRGAIPSTPPPTSSTPRRGSLSYLDSPSTSSIYYDLPSNLGPYSRGSSPVKSKHFMETYRGKGPVSFLLDTATGTKIDAEVGDKDSSS
ncbi:hypothetical protein Cantr_02304 [Candida viswanathii]|uniref:Uncharacterized protein n=1 Tax=Candida viswanathii TaxID=5486 RepID=A0A367YNR3_9ASCO|nr:hypothetical protein Cantr_02304 [Candida viswanathii]